MVYLRVGNPAFSWLLGAKTNPQTEPGWKVFFCGTFLLLAKGQPVSHAVKDCVATAFGGANEVSVLDSISDETGYNPTATEKTADLWKKKSKTVEKKRENGIFKKWRPDAIFLFLIL